MGSPFMTDPAITFRGISRPFDPIAAMSRIANLRRLQQRGQINQRQLEQMERKRTRLDDIRALATGAFEPGKGLNRAEFLQSLAQKHPLAGLEYGEKFRQWDRAAGVEGRAKEEQRLAKIQSDLDFIAQKAGPLKALEEKGADLETMQVAYADVLEWLEDNGVDTSWMPKEYTPGLADQAIREGLTANQQVTAARQAAELEERKRRRYPQTIRRTLRGGETQFLERRPGEKYYRPAKMLAPGVRELARPTTITGVGGQEMELPAPPPPTERVVSYPRPTRPSARDVSTEQQRVVARLAREAMRNAGNDTAKAIQDVNDSVDQGLLDPALLDDLIRMIMLQVRGRTRGRGSVEDEVADALQGIVQE